jgi:hypothetical protein
MIATKAERQQPCRQGEIVAFSDRRGNNDRWKMILVHMFKLRTEGLRRNRAVIVALAGAARRASEEVLASATITAGTVRSTSSRLAKAGECC